MAYRNKTYVCFDADSDMNYYRMMQAWKNNDNIDFDFHDAHDLNNLREGSNETTIKTKLRERLKNTKIFIVLIGEKTKNLFRFVRWEMDVALEMGIPIVAVNLNKSKNLDSNLCPPIIKEKLVLHIPYKQIAIKWAIDNWGNYHKQFVKEDNNSPKVLPEQLYNEWGI